MQFHNVPVRPWSKVAIDVFTVLGRDFLVTVDFYSDFWELDELTSTNTSNIILACKSHFARYGVPDELVSDNAPQFISTEFSECQNLGSFLTLHPRLTTVARMAKRKVLLKSLSIY